MPIGSHYINVSRDDPHVPGGSQVIGYLHFQSAVSGIDEAPISAASEIRVRHNSNVFGNLRDPNIRTGMPSLEQSDAPTIAGRAEICINALSGITKPAENDRRLQDVYTNKNRTSEVKKTIKNINKSDINEVYALVKAAFPKDSHNLAVFETIRDDVLEGQKEIFDKKQWDFEKQIDVSGKAQTAIISESAAASALMSALFVALRFSDDKGVSGTITAAGGILALGQLINIIASLSKITNGLEAIEQSGEMLDAQARFRDTSIFEDDDNRVIKHATGVQIEVTKTDEYGVESRVRQDVTAPLKDPDDSFRVYDFSKQRSTVRRKLLGLALINLAVFVVFCWAAGSKLKDHVESEHK